ncbi:MAG: ribosome biogenesis GTPase A [Mariniblastus sp.]|jgi:ribosome biogenesis GTPase A
MQIQWFPGHMHKARVKMKETIPKVDLVIEVLDARIPYSSENPMLEELRGDKPCLKILNKADLADPEMTQTWLKFLEKQNRIKARATTTDDWKSISQLSGLIVQMLPHIGEGKTITTMIAGIPNVGKSTIINILARKKVAKTGNEPAVTKSQQKFHIGNGVTLLDTPGVLWPNVENIYSGYRLATIGSIKETAMDYADAAFFSAKFMLEHFSDRLVDRYSLDSVPADPTEFIESLGRKRGCLGKAGVVDIDRASKIFVTELRSGKLGLLTLETPEMMAFEKIATVKRIEEATAAKAIKDQKRKQAFKQRSQPRERKRKR